MIDILLLLILILVLVYGIYNNVQSQLTMSTYIITNYMYIFVGLLLFLFTNNILEKNDVSVMRIGSRLLPLFLLTLLLLFGILMTPPTQQLPLHLMWLGFIVLISVSGYPIYLLAKQERILTKVLVTLGILFISMSYLAYTGKFEWLQGYSSYFTFGLLGLIVFESLDLILSDYNKGQDTRFWYYSIFAILLFGGLLIYDTQKVIQQGAELESICKNKDHLICANYPEKSMSIFLDLLNLFNNFTNVYRNRS